MESTNYATVSPIDQIIAHKDFGSCLDLTNQNPDIFDADSLNDISTLTDIYWRTIHLDIKDLAVLCIINIIDVAVSKQEVINLTCLIDNIQTLSGVPSDLVFAFEVKSTIYKFLNNKISAHECSRKMDRLGMKLNKHVKNKISYKNILLFLDSYFLFLTGNVKTTNNSGISSILMEYLFGDISSNNKEELTKHIQQLEMDPSFNIYIERLIESIDRNSIEIKLKILANIYQSIGVNKLAEILKLNQQNLKKHIKSDPNLSISKNKEFVLFKTKKKIDVSVFSSDIDASIAEVQRMIQEDKEIGCSLKSSKQNEDQVIEDLDEDMDLEDMERYDEFFSGSEDSF